MKIAIAFIGFPTVYDIFHEGHHTYTFSGSTLGELIDCLIKTHGERIKDTLQDSKKRVLDPAIQVMINWEYINNDSLPHHQVKEGDKVTFLKLLAGG